MEPEKFTYRLDGKSLIATRRLDRLKNLIERGEIIMSGDRPAREIAPMERLLKDAGLLRDAHYNVVHRLRMIRENMMGPIAENPTETAKKPDGNGAFGVLQDRMNEMDELLNVSLNEIIRIEKALGVSQEVASPTRPDAFIPVDRPGRIGR